MSMVEVVARALQHRASVIQERTIGVLEPDWESTSPTIRAYWSWLATAAIEAMREPRT